MATVSWKWQPTQAMTDLLPCYGILSSLAFTLGATSLTGEESMGLRVRIRARFETTAQEARFEPAAYHLLPVQPWTKDIFLSFHLSVTKDRGWCLFHQAQGPPDGDGTPRTGKSIRKAGA